MRFMVFVKLTGKSAADYEGGAMPSEADVSQMMKYNEELVDAGIMLDGQGFQPTSKGARIEFGNGKPIVTDGPFAESKELVGGYWIWKVDSKEQAVDWAKRCPLSPGDVLELRQIFEMEDFGPEIAAQEAALFERIEKGG
jgi:hypothetical protein